MSTGSDRDLVVVVLLVLAALFVLPMVFMGFGVMGMGSMMGGPWGLGDAPTAWLVVAILVRMLLLFALAAGGYLLYRALVGQQTDRDPALRELRVAYARGDLSDEEFERRREALTDERDDRRQ